MLLFLLIFFLITVSLLGSAWAGYALLQRNRKRQIHERLGTEEAAVAPAAFTITILNKDGGDAWKVRVRNWAMSQVEAAGLKWSNSKVLSLCASCTFVGALFGLRVSHALPVRGEALAFLVPALFACLPFLYLAQKRKKRLKQFEEQLPDALDFLARSLRIGNSLLMSMEMLVNESEEPLQGEFRRLTSEIRLGAPMTEPMQKLMIRVPLIDLRMFVSAVLLQRETGGNLGVLLSRIAASIRDRFRVRGQVEAASSQAKLSARVLSAMPLVVLGGIMVISPGYFKNMTDDTLGCKLLVAAAVGQLLGFMIMRKIVRIKV